MNGFVVVDAFLRAKGTTDVWAVGDISSVLRPQFVNTEKQSIHVAKNIGLLMKGKELVPFPVDEKREPPDSCTDVQFTDSK